VIFQNYLLIYKQNRLAWFLLSATVFIPFPGSNHLYGWLALGNRLSGAPYSQHDINYLVALSNQAAIALERAQAVADMERKIREMDVLTRVARGVSFTMAFDDILELIYTRPIMFFYS